MRWDATRIRDLLSALRVHRGDTTLVEVKRAAGGLPEPLASTVCAFANMPDGGTILLGVDESHSFAVTGVDNPAAMEAALVNQARAVVDPVPYVRTSSVSVEGKEVVVVQVSALPLIDRPATVDGRAYLRQADGDFVMHEHELRMIEVEKILMAKPQDYDRQVVEGLTVDDLVPEIVGSYLKNVRLRDRRLRDRGDTEILRRTGIVVASGEPTLAGLYAMGDYPQGQFPSLTVTAAVQVFSDSAGPRNRDLQHFRGPIPVLMEELMEWCQINIPLVRMHRPDGHMMERPELPLSAIRELLANSLVHRDLGPNTLGTGKSIQVRLTPNNLFVLSPGGLRGVSIEQLESEDHAQAAVNQRLYSISQKLVTSDGFPIIEGERGGIWEVFRSAGEYGLPTPTLINTGVQFKALLWRAQSGLPPVAVTSSDTAAARTEVDALVVGTTTAAAGKPDVGKPDVGKPEVSKNEPVVLSVLAQGPASFTQLREASGLNSGKLRYALNRAVDAGRVEMIGKQGDKDTVYQLGKSE